MHPRLMQTPRVLAPRAPLVCLFFALFSTKQAKNRLLQFSILYLHTFTRGHIQDGHPFPHGANENHLEGLTHQSVFGALVTSLDLAEFR